MNGEFTLTRADGSALGTDGKRYGLLSARLERFPSRTAKSSDPPWVSAVCWFRSPLKLPPRELTFTFTLRANDRDREPIRIDNLPVPGRP